MATSALAQSSVPLASASGAPPTGIRARGLTKTYLTPDGDVHAVRGVDFDVVPGEILGLLGPNGAGKTTTLRILSTLIAPSAGDAWVAGAHVVRESALVRSRIGFLTSSTGVYDRLTPVEMMALFGRLNGMDAARIAARTAMIVRAFQMESFAERLCGQLSTGQKQKTSIARTVIHDPPVLVFDEPLNGLDVLVARTVLDFLVASRAEGKTVIFSTHSLDLAERLCDRVAIIAGGELRFCGTPAAAMAGGHPTLEAAFFALVGDVAREAAISVPESSAPAPETAR